MQAVYERAAKRSSPTLAQPVVAGKKDVLELYAPKLGDLSNSVQRIRETFVILVGLGMRESSGQFYEGHDTSAGPETSATAETGLFQFSYNSIHATPELMTLYSAYRANTDLCMASVFREGLTPQVTENVGSDPAGIEFQRFTKVCPAFAVEYAADLVRVLRNHFGPLVRQEAEVIESCIQ